MNAVTHVAALLAVAAIASSNVVKNPEDGTFELLILHNNDMHARFEQTSQLSGTCTTADREAGKCYGGFPRVAHVVKEARRAAATKEGPPVLYLNAGDTYTGTAWFTIYKWKIAAEFVNALQPDAVALGNNEFEHGPTLSPFLEQLNTHILATNVILHSADNKDKLHKSIIIDIDGTKVGLVGYLTPETTVLDSAGDIEYIDEVIALKEEVAKLQASNVNIIVALGHADPKKDVEVAKEVEGIDLIIAGHKNRFYWNGTTSYDMTPGKESNLTVTQTSGKVVPIIYSYSYSKYLGKINVKFNNNGEIVAYNGNPIVLDASVPQDSDITKLLTSYNENIAAFSEEIVGETAVVLDGDTCKTHECNLGNLITDAIMFDYATKFEGERWTDAPVAIIHGGAIASSIAPTNRPASVTKSDLITALPSESSLVAVTIPGIILTEVLEHSVAQYSIKNPRDEFLQFSGIRVIYDLSNPPGSRVVNAVVRCWACFVPEYYALDSRDYKVLMPIALANGEHGYSMLQNLPREEVAYDEITCTADYIQLRTPVYPEVADRIVLLNADALDESEEDNEDSDESEEVEEDEDDPDSANVLSSTLTVILLTFIPLLLQNSV